MTVAPKHCCAHCGCVEWATHGSYCDKHFKEFLKKKEEYKKKNFLKWQEFKKKTGYVRPKEQLLYNCRRWKITSQLYLVNHPVCVICGKPATDVDHIVPHKGDEKLFWDETNYQSLCRECHNKKTYDENAASYKKKREAFREKKKLEAHAGMNVYYIK